MVFIGGLTRLTDSGLSIVEWNVFTGILPPLEHKDWIILFEKYKKYPEFELINSNIELDHFKFIFWMEYLHRLWGRLIFLIFLIPMFFFLIKNYVPKSFVKHLFIILSLILLQGFIGWFMVKSGLIDDPNVSHYRLSTHLTLAFIIYGYLLFLMFSSYDIKTNKKKIKIKNKKFFVFNILLFCLILITVFSGGMVAGLDAGLMFNTFPLMGGSFIPEGIWLLEPKFINFLENPITVQFDHRILGITTTILTFLTWLYARINKLPEDIVKKTNFLLIIVLLQLCLGIATLLSGVKIPIALAHQTGALLLYTISIWTLKSLPFVSK
tara:strand:- start:173 stop:1144 length:972 start_codon:yes stop_codon:yes gene_type:complete